jgi:tetratricopeptide (TPR) repeat protein
VTAAIGTWARRRPNVLMAVAFVAALVRVAYVLEVHDHPYYRTPLVDAADYHARAMQVARGEGLGEAVFYKAPAYPYLVGQLYRVSGARLEVAYAIQMLGGVVTAVLVADLALLWFGVAAAWIAGLLFALYTPLVYFENELLMASPALTLSVVCTFVLVRWRRTWTDLAAGTFLGLAVQLVPLNVALALALCVWLLLRRTAPWLESARRVVFLLVPVALLLIPTLGHNRKASGRLVPISVNGGINFYIGNNPDYDTTVAIRPGLAWEELTKRFGSLDDPVVWQRRFYAAAFEWMRHEPVAAARLQLKKLMLFWNMRNIDRNQDSSVLRQRSVALRYGVPWGVLTVLGLVGLGVTRRQAFTLPLHALVVVQMLGVVAFFVTTRYRIAVVPWLAIAAAVGVLACLRAARAARAGDVRRAVPVGAGIVAACLVCLPDYSDSGAHAFGRPHFDRAEVLARNGDRQGALAAYELAVAEAPDDADVQFRYGEHLERLGRRAEAMAAYERAAALAPASYKPPLALGAAAILEGELERAWTALVEADARGDPHGRTRYNRGVVREEQERLTEALDLYQQSLAFPDIAAELALRRLAVARVLIQLGRAAEAEVHYREAERLTRDRPRILREQAEAWLAAGIPARALVTLERVEGLDANARAQFVRARALARLGRMDEARGAAARAAALDPQSQAYQQLLDRLRPSARDST